MTEKLISTRLSDWIESWAQISDFCLTKQTSKAFVITLRGQALLMRELLDEGYEFIFTRRFQSDPLENRFSQYRQISGGRFLTSLREVLSNERILTCRSLSSSTFGRKTSSQFKRMTKYLRFWPRNK